MQREIHGGNVYGREVRLDFSVNINPLGMPQGVRQAITEYTAWDETYPDIECTDLRRAIAQKEGIAPEQILCGNGASELLMAVVRAAAPEKCAIAAPSFSGYERAVRAAGAEPVFYELSRDTGFGYETVCDRLSKMTVQMLFLCNPNNPTGNTIPEQILTEILQFCASKKIRVVADECFLRFHPHYEKMSCKRFLKQYPNLLIVNAFTKFYAMAGLRLGYLMTGDLSLLHAVAQQLPEWNVSSIAQRAGISALQDTDYEKRTRQLIEKERRYLIQEFLKMGCTVFPSEADYITFRLPQEKTGFLLKERLLEGKILIRSCANYRNMPPDCYRIAVKQHADNEELVRQVWRILKQ